MIAFSTQWTVKLRLVAIPSTHSKVLDFDPSIIVPDHLLMIGTHSNSNMLPAFFNQVEIGSKTYRVGIFIIFFDSEGGESKFYKDDCFSPECEVERSLVLLGASE